jgi:hypothetical protein
MFNVTTYYPFLMIGIIKKITTNIACNILIMNILNLLKIITCIYTKSLYIRHTYTYSPQNTIYISRFFNLCYALKEKLMSII